MAGGGCTFLLFIFITHFFAINGEVIHRETLQIIIGGGDEPLSPPPEYQENYPPPPPPPCPPPLSPLIPPLSPPPIPPLSLPPIPPPEASGGFKNELLAAAFKVIEEFKKKVTSDPKGITKTWVGNNICRDYKGFACDIVPNVQKKTVSGVNFNNFNFAGPNLTLSDLILGLKDIAFFHANSNNFFGTIPDDISKLEYLYELDLSNNKFSGSFPNAVLGATKLVFLDLRFNNFHGDVPPQVFQLDVDLLFINNNKFVRQLPYNIGFTPALYLTLANNNFFGIIPPTIGAASDTLLEVLFLNNNLTGCLPYQIGFLRKTTVLDVGGNSITGPIPQTFRCLEKMELLNLAQNRFSDIVPDAVCSLPALTNFTLSYNYFTRVGPLCRKLIKSGVLDMKMNCIVDLPNQRSPADCQKFYSIRRTDCAYQMFNPNIPCRKGNALESSDLELTAPVPAPAFRKQTYGALSPINRS